MGEKDCGGCGEKGTGEGKRNKICVLKTKKNKDDKKIDKLIIKVLIYFKPQ